MALRFFSIVSLKEVSLVGKLIDWFIAIDVLNVLLLHKGENKFCDFCFSSILSRLISSSFSQVICSIWVLSLRITPLVCVKISS